MINPTILACLLDKNRRVVGYFDVFPLELSFFNLFVQGICSEQDIRREHILSAASARYTKKLYLGGFAVVDPHTMKGRRYASLGVWGLVKYLQHYYHIPRDLELFAEAASKDGEELLKRFGFRVVSHENQRRSHCSLYSVYLTENIVSMTLNSLPDWSNACDLVWV